MKIKIYSETAKQYGYWVDTKYDQTLQKSFAIVVYSDGTTHETYLRNITVVDSEYLANS